MRCGIYHFGGWKSGSKKLMQGTQMAAPHYNFMGTLDGSKVTCGAIW